MSAEQYKEEMNKRLKKSPCIWGYSRGTDDISIVNDGKKDYVVAVYRYKSLSDKPWSADVSEISILCVPIEDGKLSDNGMFLSARSNEEFESDEGDYTFYERTKFCIKFEKDENPFWECTNNEFMDIANTCRLLSFVEKNKSGKNGKLAMKLCDKFIKPTEEEKQAIKEEQDRKKLVEKYRKLRDIVKTYHKKGQYAGKLHRRADKKRKEAEQKKKDELQKTEKQKKVDTINRASDFAR